MAMTRQAVAWSTRGPRSQSTAVEASHHVHSEPSSIDVHGVVQELVAFALTRPRARPDDFRGQSAVCVQTTPFMLTGGEGVVLLRLAPTTQARLVRSDPTTFCASEGRFGRVGWTRVQVRRVAMTSLKGLVREAHRLAAGRYLPKE
jgi:hypothetical protein